MVTLPSEAASDYQLVRHLVTLGMDVARINGAHDGPEAWVRMSRNVRKASDEVASTVPDLYGPAWPQDAHRTPGRGPAGRSVCALNETYGE